MFERYTEKARRACFFARYECDQFASSHIEAEHLLLGVLKEDKDLLRRFRPSNMPTDSIRSQIQKRVAPGREKFPTSASPEFSNECKSVLDHALEEANSLGSRTIGTEHLFLAILQQKECIAGEILRDLGLNPEVIRAQVGHG